MRRLQRPRLPSAKPVRSTMSAARLGVCLVSAPAKPRGWLVGGLALAR